MKEQLQAQITEAALESKLLGRAGPLRSYLARLLSNPNLSDVFSVDDLLQDVWITAFENVDSIVICTERELGEWLRSIANSRLVDSIRLARAIKRGGRWDRIAIPSNSSVPQGVAAKFVSPERTPSRGVATSESSDAVRVALASLSEEQREVISLRFLRGYSISSVAARLEKTEGAVRGLIYRGLQNMHKRLGSAAKFFTDARTTSAS